MGRGWASYLAQFITDPCRLCHHIADSICCSGNDVGRVVDDELLGGRVKSGEAIRMPHHAWICHAIPYLYQVNSMSASESMQEAYLDNISNTKIR